MPKVEFKIGSQTYDLSCGEGEEEKIRTFAASIDQRFTTLAKQFKSSSNFILTIIALTMEDEIQNLRSQLKAAETDHKDNKRSPQEEESYQEHQLTKALEAMANPIIERIETLAQRLKKQ